MCASFLPKGKSPEDVSNWLVEIQSSCNLEGLSGIVIAGWDDKVILTFHFLFLPPCKVGSELLCFFIIVIFWCFCVGS